ncbi:17-beta-hydroxysteroid dehydrogenase 14-like [Mya arenaria]|uniref:17-beta-hydroxysteroid dehydrogenase 14-like n=1 Tax=Mya arenaria TaxID=6604 RepID=UPI0022E31F73|nr:17-beta-hydroxysteroid dehydrogenase 14-like [Mya arenaria]
MSVREKKGLRFEDKVAIVTGGCQGIGRGCVDVLVEEGGKVAVFDIKDSVGKDLASGCHNVIYIHCDVRNDDEMKNGVQSVIQNFGKLDLLVNNAGYAPHAHVIDDVIPKDFRDLLNLNLISYYTMCKFSLPHLRKSKGNIVNISSIGSSSAARGMSMYCATKNILTRYFIVWPKKHPCLVICLLGLKGSEDLLQTVLVLYLRLSQGLNVFQQSCMLQPAYQKLLVHGILKQRIFF